MLKEQNLIKKDTSINWNKAKNFVPKENEIIIYTDLNKKKIGDGKTLIKDLPFVNDDFYFIEDSTLVIQKRKY